MYFGGKAHIPDFDCGYKLYTNRCSKTPEERILRKAQYGDIIKAYCKHLAQVLESNGTIDLPCGMGTIAAVSIRRKPTYDRRNGKWRVAEAIDWKRTREAGEVVRKDSRHTFGFIFSPRREKGYENLRAYGIRANARLYRKMRKQYDDGMLPFYLPDIEIYA